MKYKELLAFLRNNMEPILLQHSLGVQETARQLAFCYNADAEKAALAGLLHDYGKLYPESLLEAVAREQNLLNDLMAGEPQLLHAPVGSWLVNKELNIQDHDILQAIRWHTTGSPGVNFIGLIIYVADFCEPGRSFPEALKIREQAFRDLPGAALAALSHTLRFLLQEKRRIHPSSWKFYDKLVLCHKKA